MDEQQVRKNLALIAILALTAILAYALWPYLNSFLSAFILFVLFRPLFKFLTNKLKLNRGLAAASVIVVTVFVVLIPLAALVSVLFEEVQDVAVIARDQAQQLPKLDELFPQVNWQFDLSQQIGQISQNAGKFFFGTVEAIGNQVISYVIMYFLLYFLLVADEKKLKELIWEIVPFNKDNTAKLEHEFKHVTYSTLITTGLIALIQGALLTAGFLFFKIEGAFLWGFVAAILSFLPVVGTPVVWIPAGIILLLQQNYFAGVGILIWGVVIANVDNFLRPYIQKKVGQIHPFVSLLGIFVGLSLFGLIGIVIGPLLLSYFVLTVRMFKEEYIKS